MGDLDRNTESDGYRPPDPIGLPPIFAWPVRPIKSVKWLLVEFLFPWSFIFVGLAIVSWNFLTPAFQFSCHCCSCCLLKNFCQKKYKIFFAKKNFSSASDNYF